jgi:hypothetical protein
VEEGVMGIEKAVRMSKVETGEKEAKKERMWEEANTRGRV